MYTERQPGQTDRSAIIAQMDKSCGNCELRIRPAKCDFYPVREAFEAVMRRGLCLRLHTMVNKGSEVPKDLSLISLQNFK